jgi:release factor glutamine methyltransferase
LVERLTIPGQSVGEALAWASRLLARTHDTGRIDAEVLLAHALQKSRVYLYAYPEEPLSADGRVGFVALVARRARGEPVAYLVGRREFWSLDLEVSPDTLIPRPETERLVAAALARIPRGAAWRVADLGTGTGAVAIALARERPRLAVVATDRSDTALAVATRNVERLASGRVRLVRGDWVEALDAGPYDAVVSNPPYVAEGDPRLGEGDVAFEPGAALVGGRDGLEAHRAIVPGALGRLRPGGWLLVEHGNDQGAAVRELFDRHGYQAVRTVDDLEGRERVTEGQRPWPPLTDRIFLAPDTVG